MTVVLVHGVPETPALWEGLRRELGRLDVVAVQLPGFGSPRPAGFGSTKEEYVDFLVDELERVADEPVDLVGHDWGGGLVVRLVSIRPDLVRSWVTDAAGIGSSKFTWHDFAKIWQTPGEGEQFFDQQLEATPAERASVFEMFGVPSEEAVMMAGWIDRTMADSILALYRSAVDVGQEWAPEFRNIPAPGLVLVPSEDPFLSDEVARDGAERSGAQVAPLPGLGHWWMLQDPKVGARLLEEFWAKTDAES
jgi:pimeloyl-ACP methyl ester carboxylesterase